MNATEARDAILAILRALPDAQLPEFTVREDDGCIWFDNLSMGWISASNPELMTAGQVSHLLACEAASRELTRRKAAA